MLPKSAFWTLCSIRCASTISLMLFETVPFHFAGGTFLPDTLVHREQLTPRLASISSRANDWMVEFSAEERNIMGHNCVMPPTKLRFGNQIILVSCQVCDLVLSCTFMFSNHAVTQDAKANKLMVMLHRALNLKEVKLQLLGASSDLFRSIVL